MAFESILDMKQSPYKGGDRPTYLLDLNLDQVVDRIALNWGGDVGKYYTYFPKDNECENYRRAVLADVRKETVKEALSLFVSGMKERKILEGRKQTAKDPKQKQVLHVMEAAAYLGALRTLQEQLQKEEFGSDGMRSFFQYLTDYLKNKDNEEMISKAFELYGELNAFRLRLTYEDDYLLVAEASEMTQTTYRDFLEQSFGQAGTILNPFLSSVSVSRLEREIIEVFEKKHSMFFEQVEAYARRFECYMDPVLLQFGNEIEFYLSFLSFEKMMQEHGYDFTTPLTDQKNDMYADGMYDVALACALIEGEKRVVANSMVYHEGESFFVLTGPNQGGKTTFARSLGQLVYFSKMGLDVPAKNANVHFFVDILTHFSVEESVETGRGKLKEELSRLSPMMKNEYKNAFVIINELFTTAANYDACIMGQRVLAHFIGMGCYGIYVTHLKELTEAHEKIVSLRAMVDEHNRQNFCITRSKADDTVCAINQVEKYQLRYEQLKERLSL